MSDEAAKAAGWFEALQLEHIAAARVSRCLSDELFTMLLAAGSDLLEIDGSVQARDRVVEAMANCIHAVVISASGGYRDFALPAAAGYLLDAIHSYSLLQTNALSPGLRTSSLHDFSRSTFRDLMDRED